MDSKITALGASTTPDDADLFVNVDVSDTSMAATGTDKKTTWANIKATLKTYFDTLYPAKAVPYKFSVWRNAAANTGSGAFAVVAFDTEIFDTGSNVSSGVFTAPVTGYYHFNAGVLITGGTTHIVSLFVDGTEEMRGTQVTIATSVGGCVVGGLIYLTANQTVDVRAYSTAGNEALTVGNKAYNYFTGYLVST